MEVSDFAGGMFFADKGRSEQDDLGVLLTEQRVTKMAYRPDRPVHSGDNT